MDNTIWIVLGVFAGLIALIMILKAVRARQDSFYTKEEEAVSAAPVSTPAIANRAELAAVVASSIAEVMGKDVSGLRIVSIKQV
jgi:Na+-transporting methylmalonyl-CoA/oxaloacetate decarboxylase gamma subunit